MNKTRTLNVLDFSPGIRASYINENFELLKKWIEEERLRVSGWGLVEGFELTYDHDNYRISVSDGIMINKQGEEIEIEGETFDGYELDPEYGLRPRVKNFLEQNVVVENCKIVLQYPIYTEDSNSVVYNTGTLPSDLKITNSDTGVAITSSQIRSIAGNTITLIEGLDSINIDAEYKITVNIEGEYAGDRIDGIFIRRDASSYSNGSMFRYEKGLNTDTPTCQEDEYIIGYAYWHVGEVTEVEFILSDRSYRQVYVDENGQLWLMGKLYEGYKFILFKEEEKEYDEETGDIKESYNYPDGNPTATEYDLWYDTDENILKVYRKNEDGEYNWFPVNDLSKLKHEKRVYKADELPEDMQTFNFDDTGDLNLHFVPGEHQLTVIIDQVVMMEDQIVELYDADDTSKASGYGFKLVEPLDNETIVEVRVDHNAYRTEDYYKDLFEKIACFVYDNTIDVTSAASNMCYKLGAEYQPGNRQLEIWVNGIKLVRATDFFECRYENGTYTDIASGDEELANAVKIVKALKAGDVIYYKISRYMSTYANFKVQMDEVKALISDLDDKTSTNITNHLDDYEEFSLETNKTISGLDKRIENIEKDYRKASEKISQSDITTALENKVLHQRQILKNIKTTADVNISGSTSDFFYVIWMLEDERFPLIRDYDYFLDEGEETGTVILSLASNWQSSKAKLYIEKINMSEV